MRPINLLLLLLPLTIISCGLLPPAIKNTKNVNWNNMSEITDLIDTKYDHFKKVTTSRGPYYPGYVYSSNVVLRAWKYDISPIIYYQIYFSAYIPFSYFFYTTYDSDGKEFDTTHIDIEYDSFVLRYYEEVGISVDRKYLEDHKVNGIQMKVVGKKGDKVFTIPSSYITAFLNYWRID